MHVGSMRVDVISGGFVCQILGKTIKLPQLFINVIGNVLIAISHYQLVGTQIPGINSSVCFSLFEAIPGNLGCK